MTVAASEEHTYIKMEKGYVTWNQCITLKKKFKGQRAQQLQVLVALAEDQAWFPEPTMLLETIQTSSS